MRGIGRRLAVWLLFLSIPFVMLSWLWPFITSRTIGNDYTVYTPGDQLELMWSVWRGTFPLYMPGFAGGHSTAAMTLGQLYHPLPWISSIMPGYWTGLSLEWSTAFRLLSLGLAQLALFKLCRRLHLSPLLAFLVTFPVVYNLRMLDSFRYGASLESYVAMLLIVAAAGFVFLDSRAKRPVVFLGFSTYLIVVSGHPQWAFLGLTIAGLFAVLFPWTAAALDPGRPQPEWTQLRRFTGRLTLGFGTGLLLASPYLLTFYFEFFRSNQSRVKGDYAWTLGCADSVQGVFSNFLWPLHADAHGAFGGSALFLIAALFPLAALVQRPPRVLWILYGIGVVAYLFALGKETWIHSFMVEHLPLFGAFRVPGRIVLWIPVTTLPVLAWMLRGSNRAGLVAAGLGGLVLFATNWLWTTSGLPATETYSPLKILGSHIPAYVDPLILYLSGATLLLVTVGGRVRRFPRLLLLLPIGCMIVTTWFCLSNGTWRRKKPTMTTFQQLTDNHKSSVASHANAGDGMEMRAVTEYVTHQLPLDRGLGTIARRVERLVPASEVIRRLQEKAKTPILFIDRPVVPLSTESIADHDEVKLVHNTSNRFVFDVVAGSDGYFVLGLPWVPGFSGKVDGVSADLALADALFPAVFVPRGKHQVDIRFVSRPFLAGVALCFVTTWAWIFASFRRRRWLLSALAVLSAAALGLLLYFAVLKGPSFGTIYTWRSPAEPATSSR